MKSDSSKKLSPDDVAFTRPQVFALIADTILEGLYKNGLSSTDYCIVWCERGDRWKENLLHFDYDVIIVDFTLFPADPINTLLAIKKLSPESSIIVLTDNEDVRIAIAAFRMGITDYFLKPTNPESLTWAVERILRTKAVVSQNEVLSGYLEVFEAAHNISVCENDSQMRTIAMKTLCRMLDAEGSLWLWPPLETEGDALEKRHETFEFYMENEEQADQAYFKFIQENPKLVKDSFQSGLSGRPAEWFQKKRLWIPLQQAWMGGILVPDVPGEVTAARQSQVEFLLRNLEVSLENHKRLMEAKQLTYIDDLTGLYNSRYLDLAVTAAIEESKRNPGYSFSLLFIDIDHFKLVNDTHGHLVGSQTLIEIGNFLKKTFRKSDLLFRYGGDEFIVVLYNASIPKSMEVAERLRAEVEARRFIVYNTELRLTLSIGVARFPDHGTDKKQVIQMADDAMYSGKRSGRNAVFISGKEAKSAIRVTAVKK